jgi:hypothetical protein
VEAEATPRTSRSRVAQLLGHARVAREAGGEFADAEERRIWRAVWHGRMAMLVVRLH